MAKLVAKTYGDALLELALEENQTDSLLKEAQALKDVFLEQGELVQVLNHPKIQKEEKVKLVENIFEGRISKNMLGFLTIVIRKERQKELIRILDYFIAAVKEHLGIGMAYVVTAVRLKDEQKQKIKEKLISTTAYQELEMNYSVDETLIGGMVIRIGDRVVDSSIRSKLDRMSRDLMQIHLS